MARSSQRTERPFLELNSANRTIDPIFGLIPLPTGGPIIAEGTFNIWIDGQNGDDLNNDGLTQGSPLQTLFGAGALLFRLRKINDGPFLRAQIRIADYQTAERFAVPYPFTGWNLGLYDIDQIYLDSYDVASPPLFPELRPKLVSGFPFEGIFVGGGVRKQSLDIGNLSVSSPIIVRRLGRFDTNPGMCFAPYNDIDGVGISPACDGGDWFIRVEDGGELNVSNFDIHAPYATALGPTELITLGSLFLMDQNSFGFFNGSINFRTSNDGQSIEVDDAFIVLRDNSALNFNCQGLINGGNIVGPKYEVGDNCFLRVRNDNLSLIPGDLATSSRGKNSMIAGSIHPGPFTDDTDAGSNGVAIGSDYYDTSGLVRIRLT